MRTNCIEVSKNKSGRFEWKFKSANGAVLALGANDYSSKQMCIKGVNSFISSVSEYTTIVDRTSDRS